MILSRGDERSADDHSLVHRRARVVRRVEQAIGSFGPVR